MATLPYRFAIGLCCVLIIKYAVFDATEMHSSRLRFWVAVLEVTFASVMLAWALFLKDEHLFALLAWAKDVCDAIR